LRTRAVGGSDLRRGRRGIRTLHRHRRGEQRVAGGVERGRYTTGAAAPSEPASTTATTFCWRRRERVDLRPQRGGRVERCRQSARLQVGGVRRHGTIVEIARDGGELR